MEPILKMSEIRAKFPMYSDLSDEQLLMGVRQKFYADIPPNKFYAKIDFDTERERLNPSAGGGTLQVGPLDTGIKTPEWLDRGMAGVGKAITDLGRGVGQVVGAVSRDDVAESRRLDQPLMDTTAGKVGNVAGNVAATLPLAFVPGANTLTGAALIGGATGLAAPSVSTQETLTNIGMGGALGPAAIVAGRGLAAGYQGVKGLVEPLTKSGQERVAAKTLQSFATNPQQAAQNMRNAKQFVPGSVPTMAQASGDSGLAQLERTLANNPETGGTIAARLADQRAARLGAVQQIAGTDEYYNLIKDGIRTFAKQDYDAAIKAGFEPKALAANKDALAKLLERPSIKSAQSVAQDLAKETGEELTDLGSVRGLDYLVKALDNKISAAKNVGSSVGKEELRALVGTKNELMGLIEKVAPAYKEARSNFAAMSKPKNSMDAARSVLEGMQNALGRYGANTSEQRLGYARALEKATESVKRSTGMDVPLSSVMPTRDIAALEGVAQDMARASTADNLGRAVGSNTAQNLASQNLLRRTLGPTGLPQSWAESTTLQTMAAPLTGLYKLGGADQRIMNRLAEAAVNPQDAAGLLLLRQELDMLERAGLASQRFLPVLPMAGLLGQPQQ